MSSASITATEDINSSNFAPEVLRLLALTEPEFNKVFRETHPQIPSTLDLENDAFEIFALLMEEAEGTPHG